MYKNYTKELGIPLPIHRYIAKLLLIMRLTTLIMIITFVQVSAATLAQKVSLNKTNAPLKSVLKDIKSQSGYNFIITESGLKESKPVSINVKDADLKNALDKIFNNQELTYSINRNTITITEKDPSFLDKVATAFTAIDVHGRVLDEKGQPLPGVTVKLKDESQVTTTDNEGNFLFKKVDEKSVLVISYIGYLTKEINAASDLGTITLELSNSKLDEVQIQAYGRTSQRLNTGDIVSVKAIDIEKQPINNPLLSLQGRVPGLEISPSSGLAGAAVNLQIRGKNSLNFDTQPLIVIDGLPVVNNITGLGHFNLDQFSSLSFLNPNEIESIDVLKDADATSIYGSRGANGVILITTKKGNAGQTKIDINAQSGVGNVAKKIGVLNTSDYLQLRKEYYINRGINLSTQPQNISNADVKYFDQSRYTDWQKELIGNTAKYNDLQGSISGGTNTLQYLVGGNYHKETTVFPGDNNDQKGSAHMSISGSSQNQKFRATFNAIYMVDNNTLPGVDYTNDAITLPPNAPALYLPDGTLNWQPFPTGSSSWSNPLAELYRTYDANVTNLLSSAELSYKVIPSLTLKTQLGYSLLNGKSFRKTYPFAGRPPEELSSPASASSNSNSMKNVSFEPQILYNTTIGNGSLNVLLGASMQNTTNLSSVIDADGFTSDALLENFESATSYGIRNTSSQYKYAALFGRLNYNVENKYLVNLNIRRDGSSRFGPGKQFGNFGSIGTAWIFTEENFVKKQVPFLSYGKLRISYGTSGNDAIGDYQYLERYQVVDASDPYQGVKGYSTTGIFNQNYGWEVTKKLELGLELGFFKDRLLLSSSYYRNRSDNQLIQYPYASLAGPGNPTFNLPATIQNSGLEFMLNTSNIVKTEFKWTTSFNLTINRNKLVSYPGIENSAYYQSIVGQPFYGNVLVYKFAGVDPQSGRYQFYTANGDKTFDPADNTRTDGGRFARVYTAPKFYGGFSNTFKYSGFSLDVFFQFTKQMGPNPLSAYLLRTGRTASNVPQMLFDRWQHPGDITNIQKNGYNPITDYLNSTNNVLASDFAYVDASFIRLKNLSLSYTMSGAWREKLKIKNLRVFVQGQNLWTLTKYKGLDPETLSMSALPPLRILTTGIQATF